MFSPNCLPIERYGILGMGYRVLGTGYWVLGTGCCQPSLKFRLVKGAGYWVLGTGCWALGTGYWVLPAFIKISAGKRCRVLGPVNQFNQLN
jgi:hypothetical protein